MTNSRLFTFIGLITFAALMPAMLIAQAPAPIAASGAWAIFVAWLNWFWLTPFVLGGVASLLPVLAVDFQAFKAFQSVSDLKAYDWGLAAFRAAQAFVVGGLAGSIFKTVVTG